MNRNRKWLVILVMMLIPLFCFRVKAAGMDDQSALLADGSACPSPGEAYDSMIALKTEYPEGMHWDNFSPYGSKGTMGDTYWFKGGKIKGASGGVGCAAFAFILSDTAFGDLPARTLDFGDFTFDDVKAGDILRIYNNSHFVIVLQKTAGGVIVAEANYNKSVHWGRAMSEAEVMAADFLVTRYPAGYISPDDPDADAVVQEGTEGSLSWTLTKAGTLTVSGKGSMSDYSLNDTMPGWYTFKDHILSIVIENGITGIGNYAFYGTHALSVYMPDGIARIGANAFRESGLVSVTIPQSVRSIEDDAFRKCVNLTSATVHEGLTSIGERAFHSCTALTYIDFPASIQSIGAGAFTSCENLLRVRFMPGTSGTVSLGNDLFTECWRLNEVVLPQTLTKLAPGMFSSCKLLTELYIPKSVTSLAEVGEDSPFKSSVIGTIKFGGSESAWNAMLNPYIRPTLQNIQVIYDVAFDDPFAADQDDPGDWTPDDGDPGTVPGIPDDGSTGTPPGTPDDGNQGTIPGTPDGEDPGTIPGTPDGEDPGTVPDTPDGEDPGTVPGTPDGEDPGTIPSIPDGGTDDNDSNKDPVWNGKDDQDQTSAVTGVLDGNDRPDDVEIYGDRRITATPTASSTILLSWESVPNARSYEVFYSTSPDSGFKRLTSTRKTSCKFAKAKCGVTYYFQMRICEKSAKSEFGLISYAQTVLTGAPTLQVKKTTYNSVQLKWSKIPGAKTYEIYCADSLDGTWQLLASKSGTCFSHKKLVTGATYYYQIRPVRDSFQGSWSNGVSATTVLGNISGLKAKASGTEQIKVSWKKVKGATQYVVLRSASLDGTYEIIGHTGRTSYTDVGLQGGTAWFYKVYAVSGPYRTRESEPAGQTARAAK